jgi:hypothetical protein
MEGLDKIIAWGGAGGSLTLITAFIKNWFKQERQQALTSQELNFLKDKLEEVIATNEKQEAKVDKELGELEVLITINKALQDKKNDELLSVIIEVKDQMARDKNEILEAIYKK